MPSITRLAIGAEPGGVFKTAKSENMAVGYRTELKAPHDSY